MQLSRESRQRVPGDFAFFRGLLEDFVGENRLGLEGKKEKKNFY
jgi:hypothetical protein